MRPNASHLYKSRHGIWYFRWVVPLGIRKSNPELPKELKRSLKTADMRKARALARRLHYTLLLRFANGQDMSSMFDDLRLRAWTVKLNASKNKITEVSMDPEKETPETLSRYDQMMEFIAQQLGQSTSRTVAPPQGGRTHSAPSMLIGHAIAQYGRLQMQAGVWSENTFKHTHEPSLRLFKELLETSNATIDTRGERESPLQLQEVSRKMVEKFLEDFWKYPAQQGKRSDRKHARDVLNEGGTPQSRANVFKRLAHIRQFLAYCSEKGYVGLDLLKELDLVLSKDTARAREKAAMAKVGADGVLANGYVAFTGDDIQALFGPALVEHADKNPARFWIPLFGLFSGLRVAEASQLKPSDFEVIDGIPCVRVAGDSVGESSDANSQRLKTPSSRRCIPLHPKLIELGLLDYVKDRREWNAPWLWDGLLWTPKSGYGKYPSRDFQKLAVAVGVHQPKRKVFHSFRSTIAQELERCGLEGELIDRFLGHEVKSTRNQSYNRTDLGRAFPVRRVFEILQLVTFPIHLEARQLKSLRASKQPPQRA